jgi:actin-related protein
MRWSRSMEFDKSRVYTSVNADELKVGSKVIVGDNLSELKEDVLKHRLPKIIKKVESEDNEHRFLCDDSFHYALVYLISDPEEKTDEEKLIDYRSVIYAIEHILLVYEKGISPNLHNKLTHWKKNIQEELDKE